MKLVRRKVEELLVAYRLEPTLRDCFVEGEADESVFRSFFRGRGKVSVSVKAVKWVDVPDAAEGGDRERIISLARKLKNGGCRGSSVRLVCDQDYGYPNHYIECGEIVVQQEFSCLESYVFAPDIIAHLFSTVYNKAITEELVASIIETTKRLFFLRAAKERFCRVSWIDPQRFLKYNSGSVCLDEALWVKCTLENQGARIYVENVLALYNELFSGAVQDFRLYVNGHDFVDVMLYAAGKLGVSGPKRQREVLVRAMLAIMVPEYLIKHDSFKELADWAAK